MITAEHINYLTLRNDHSISFLPKGKEHVVNDSGSWARDNRQNGAPARVIKKVLTPNALKLFKDSEFTSFVNQYKAASDAECRTFVLRENFDIGNVYDMEIERGGSSLNQSCMNGDGRYMRIYEKCKSVKILTLLDGEGRLCGRSLIWFIKKDDKDYVVMDRIYVSQEHYYDMFLEYADKNGWYRKKKFQSYSDPTTFILNGEEHELYFKIYTDTDCHPYPYIDTFRYGNDGYLQNFSDGCQYEYDSTGGERTGDEDRYFCEYHEEYFDEDDVRYIERGTYAGGYVHRDYTVYCESDRNYYYEEDDNIVCLNDGDYYRIDDDNIVKVNGHYYHIDSDDICEVDGEWVERDDAEWSDFHDCYLMKDDSVWSDHHESVIRSDEAYEVLGNYYHESVVNKVA